MPIVRPAQASDWPHFCALTAVEGWRVPQFELQLFQSDWSSFVQVLEVDGGFAGLVTAVPHERSGWIGNLIVPPQLRGKGYGLYLFQAAFDELTSRGMSTIWLTASVQGRPIYTKAGFVTVGQIERWVLPAAERTIVDTTSANLPRNLLLDRDRSVWREKRYPFLERLLAHGQLFSADDTLALLQKGSDLQIIGPWYARNHCSQSNFQLLQKLMAAVDRSIEISVDLFASAPLHDLFASAGFVCVGQADLMVYGDVSSVNLQTMVALASLGSIG